MFPLCVWVKLGDDATPAHVLEHPCEKAAAEVGGGGGVSEELEALMSEPVEVGVTKAVRKMDVSTGGEKSSFEVTGTRAFGGGRGCVLVIG